MARSQKFTAQEVLDAIPGTGGIKALVAKNLQCDRATVGRYAQRYVTIQKALKDEDEGLTDLAEAKAVKLINAEYWPAIRFRLETKGKKRGYVQKQEIKHSGEQEVTVNIICHEGNIQHQSSSSAPEASGDQT